MVEGLFKTHVGVDLEVFPWADAHAGRPLAHVETAVVAQVQATVERADGRGFDQALGHAAGGGGAKLEVEAPQLTLKDLCLCHGACQQAAEQCRKVERFEHASLHELRGQAGEPAETLDPDVCKDTGE
ncbi:hypothetical protein D3C73_1267780 [compost metagenome]